MVTVECLLQPGTAVNHSFDTWADGSFLYMANTADTYHYMQNTVLDTLIWHRVDIESNLFEQ